MAAAAKCKPVYAVLGDEGFLRRQGLSRIESLVQAEDPGGLGPAHLEGDQAELADAMDELQTPSLLGGMRLVVVHDADKFVTKYRSQLESYCANPSDFGCLVLVCKTMPKNTRLYKAIAAKGEVIDCKAPTGRSLRNWVMQRARDPYQKRIDAAACERLCELSGGGLEALDNELSKLAVYTGAREKITVQDVDALVGNRREEAVFRVTDAMANGDTAGAIRAWEQVLATDRDAPMRAVGGLAFGVRRLLELRQKVDAGASIDAVTRPLGWIARTMAGQLRRLSTRQLAEQLCDLYELDRASKTGLASIETTIETFIVKHAAGRQMAPA